MKKRIGFEHVLFWTAGMSFIFVTAHAQPVSDSTTTISPSSSHLTIKDKAALWGIDETDYIRYTDIIQGPLQYWNPTIDPVLALGIFAESDAEKKRFAEIYARQEYALITKTQEFERLFRTAFQRLYPQAQMVSSKLMAPYHQHRSQKKADKAHDFSTNKLIDNDRILFFLRRDCHTCSAMIDHLSGLARRYDNIFIDFYILDAMSDADARAWALTQDIPTDLVQQGKVTINIDDGAFDQLKRASQKATDVFLHRGDSVYAVTKNELFLQ